MYEEAGTDLFAETAYASDTLYPHFPRSVTVPSRVDRSQCPRVRPNIRVPTRPLTMAIEPKQMLGETTHSCGARPHRTREAVLFSSALSGRN